MGLYRRKNTGNWQLKIKYNGKTHRKSSGTSNKKRALSKDAEFRLQIERGEIGRKSGNISLKELSEIFLEYAESKYSLNYFRSLRSRLNKWVLPYFDGGVLPATSVKRWQIEKLLADRKKTKSYNGNLPTQSEIYQLLVAIKSMYSRAIEGAIRVSGIKENPCKDINETPPKITTRRALSHDEQNRVLKYNGFMAIPILFMIDTGARRGEALSLQLNQIDLKRNMVTIYATKTENERMVPMTNRLRMAMMELVPFFNSPYAFPRKSGDKNRESGRMATEVTRERINHIIPITGVDFKYHELRHTAITNWIEKGIDLPPVQYLAGHKKIETTMIYAHNAADRAKDAIRRMGK